jgi:hypothetical protein
MNLAGYFENHQGLGILATADSYGMGGSTHLCKIACRWISDW